MDGTTWEDLGTGASTLLLNVRGATAEFGGDIYFGGCIVSAGGKPSFYMGRWRASVTEVPVIASSSSGGLQVSPNPTTGLVTLRLDTRLSPASFEVAVLDVRGRQLARLPIGEGSADLREAGLSAGTYFVVAESEGRRYVRKIVLAD